MENTLSMERLQALRGATVYDSAGDKIGSVDEIYYDEQTRQPEWIGIGTGFFGMKRVVVPVEGASVSDDDVRLPYAKDQVKDSPSIDGDAISEQTERDLYAHYGLQASERRSDSMLPQGGQGVAQQSSGYAGDELADRDASMTRSEEELRVGTRQVDAGHARLRKWVETEPVEADVELRRETVRVERQPVDEPVSGATIGEDDIDVPLSREEAVVDKQTVARERIGLSKDVDTRTETISDEVRKERVDVDADAGLDR